MTPRFTRRYLVPAWIMSVGLLSTCLPPLGVPLTLGLATIGLLVIPAALLIPSLIPSPARS